MAFNIIAQFNKKPDFDEVHQLIFDEYHFDIYPVVDEDEKFYAIGISIPSDNFNQQTWQSVVDVILKLQKKYLLTIFDLIHGRKITNILNYNPN